MTGSELWDIVWRKKIIKSQFCLLMERGKFPQQSWEINISDLVKFLKIDK